ncbi:T9SS type A sorting domain-containing protein [Kaistella sp.]|uniref:T9SS type A sorting domain-containing protein n=1 Tax=Kaistella sp. TaxID=2782235 RepID=UPI002F9527A7
MKGIKKTSDFEIFSTDGKLIRKGKYSPSQTIDVSRLKVGVYFLKINAKSFKFVKE